MIALKLGFLLIGLCGQVLTLRPQSCYLGADFGLCSEYYIMYYYNADRDKCEEFAYTGCLGNSNRYATLKECQDTCKESENRVLPSGAPSPSIFSPSPDSEHTTISAPSPLLPKSNTVWSCTTPRDRQIGAENFWMRSSFFHLFPAFKVVCAGAAFKWQVVSRVGRLSGLYLSVWRPVENTLSTFKMIGMTRIQNMTVTPDQWTDVNIKDRFTVSVGDVIGYFYDDWEFTDSSSSIPLLTLPTALATPADKAYVHQFDASGVFNSSTVNLRSAAREARRPALALIVDPTGSARIPEISSGTVVNHDDPSDGRSEFCLDSFRIAGSCKFDMSDFQMRWYFDQADGRCQMFWYYPECASSANIFETKVQCEANCRTFFSTANSLL